MSDILYTISARGKPREAPVMQFLQRNFSHLPLNQIDSLFGFVEWCPIYGGRSFNGRQLSDQDIYDLYKNNIGIRIPLTSSLVSREEYLQVKPLLEKYHRKGNSIITTVEDLAKWVREDYPNYGIEASVIKDISSQEKIDSALAVYDTVILPMRFCVDFEFLDSLQRKDNITLFANAGCAYNCPAKICYNIISKGNKSREYSRSTNPSCSKLTVPRPNLGVVDFDIVKLASLGYKRFKLLRGGINSRFAF